MRQDIPEIEGYLLGGEFKAQTSSRKVTHPECIYAEETLVDIIHYFILFWYLIAYKNSEY